MGKLSLCTMAVLACSTAMAANEEKPPADESNQIAWNSEVELGFVSTGGNTETDTISAKVTLTREQPKWRNTGKLAALNISDKTGTTAERYDLNLQSDYKFSRNEYIYGIVNYENDRFSGYDYRVSESLGYGRRLIDRSGMTLDLEVGPGARQSELNDGSRKSVSVVRGAMKYRWNITSISKFSEDLTVEDGQDATISKSVTALTSRINGSLSMRLSYTVRNTSVVPPNIKKTDTETAMTLVYSY